LGLAAAALILALSILQSVFALFNLRRDGQQRRRILGYRLYPIIFVSFVLTLISGFFGAAFEAVPIKFWGTLLPIQITEDKYLADFFGATHQAVAYVLAGFILTYFVIVMASIIRRPGISTPLFPFH
jgi:hypothetical protein